jgi:hypothetical protein
LYWGISDFKKVCQPRTSIVWDEKVDLVTDCRSILARWRNNFSQLFIVHEVSDVKQAEIHTAIPLVPELSALEFEVAIEKLKRLPGTDQIPAELVKAGHRTICCEIYQLVNSIWNKEELPEAWKESIFVLIHKNDDNTECSNCRGLSL